MLWKPLAAPSERHLLLVHGKASAELVFKVHIPVHPERNCGRGIVRTVANEEGSRTNVASPKRQKESPHGQTQEEG